MYLKKIKISGFKSFVDTTELLFPHDMTAVVGPNGCGKSNIIDAVRWVLGESSAKHLRGDAMSDVIFNGSVARSPVSRASVELLFDNAQQRIDHALLQYNEVSIRRELYRDGTNQYYLNGKKCRRKDVTELFLGTGLGPRSYAIIEQGMISRLIESKPHELRHFIEEAAGISKYKEKRRETELRINQTKDNLNRLADIRIELGVQIDKLKVQSVVAQQFRSLKQQQREAKSRLGLVQIYDVERSINQLAQQKLVLMSEQEKFTATATKLQTQMTDFDVQLNELTVLIENQQQTFYLQGTELTKIEQKILHHKARKQESAGKQQEYQQQSDKLQILLKEEQAQLQVHQQQSLLTETDYNRMAAELLVIEQSLASATISSDQAIAQHAVYLDKVQRFTSKLDVLTNALQSAESVLNKSKVQRSDLKAEQQLLLLNSKQVLIKDKITEQQQLQSQETRLGHELAGLNNGFQGINKQVSELETYIQKNVTEQTEIKASLSVITELLRKAEHANHAHTWLECNFESIPLKLLQQLDVEPGWEAAVEKVLANWLDAYCISDEQLAQFNLAELPALQWFKPSNCVARAGSLASKVKNNLFNRQLNQVTCAATINDAQAGADCHGEYSYITAHGDWFTDEGVWLSQHAKANVTSAQGRIEMQQQASQQQARLFAVETMIATQQHQLTALSVTQVDYQDQIDKVQANLTLKQSEVSQLTIELGLLQQQQAQWQLNHDQLNTRLSTLDNLLAIEAEEVQRLNEQIISIKVTIEQLASDDGLIQKSETAKADKARFLQEQKVLEKQVQQLLLVKTKFTVEIEKQQQLIAKTDSQYQTILQDIAALGDNSLYAENLQQLETARAIAAEKQIAIENDNRQKKTTRAKLFNDKRDVEEKRARIMASGLKVKDKVQQLDLKQANNKAKEQLLYQQIADDNVDIDTLKRECVNILTLKEYQQQLKQFEVQLQNIGAVNLAAVEEYEQQSQRKQYLDEQTDDLEKAIATLEAAIVKIDKQTKARFATTFEKINDDFKMLFPKVFGGGAAWLELTSSNLLDTGVTIMARPPGKKNARISLLSGGEKALTALSLVFAIFRLNPAPFCMLDEVDAPLDELNVGRFCKLVQEMSETVQFIYISHNKLAMEMAQQLIGVTMHEPGVSRIVAVDISTAIELTDH
ncbi:chromosome segregation protein SMC [Moritella viscosa]|uniref:Chromosome partition protein Smc n=1 Tax=Moritella viscosa TaxID=80854 RepID=A0ABY1HK17_9GAMM|nr:chromosome segregation protein SMC [Moritella viscosa]SGZ03659.1 Chromosome segregation ATPase, sms [Moritella viscosa]SGZ17812.1 Chromosome segregation ATPase, sms [Moritella viscosa]SHO28320.1 Chromosome segregation ATPase, sms [Moritella viscosa]